MVRDNHDAFSNGSKKKRGGEVGNREGACFAMGIFLNEEPVFGIRAEQFVRKRDKNRLPGKLPQINLRL